MSDSLFFDDIFLGGRSRNNLGQLRVSSGGIQWKKKQGDKAVEVNKFDVVGLTWMKVPRTNQLLIRLKDGFCLKFTGFRDLDIASMNNFFKRICGIIPEEKQLSVTGRNWGVVDLNGNMLTFMVDSKQAFEVSLADVLKTQMQGKNEVALEFHVDDTTGVNEIDTLMDMTFHVPVANTQFIGDKECTPAEAFHRKIISVADVCPEAEEAVVAFENLCILTPRGRYNIDLNLSFLRLQARGIDFKIQYSSIVRLFSLPKSKQPHTFVVIALNPPIWRGKTLYPHIVIQFETDIVIQRTLSMSEYLFKTKYKDKLAPSYTGLLHDVFTTILRALSGAKVTRPGNFRSCQDGYAMRSSLRAQDGLLYPLERSFFFLPKPPTLVLHGDIVYVEFQRHIAGSLNGHYFDLLVKLRGNEQDHLFHNIHRSELHNLFTFISSKGIKVLNPGGVRTADGGIKIPKNHEEDGVDPHLERIKYSSGDEDDSDEDDVDFVVDKDDLDSSKDSSNGDSSEEESDGQ